MIKDRVVDVFFVLLRAGLWNRPVESTASFPLSDTEWDSLFQLAVQQTVEGIVYDGLESIDVAFLPPRKTRFEWFARIEHIERRNDKINTILAEQVVFFSDRGLHPLLLKGQALAACYHNPTRRICGDIDWYFDNEHAYNEASDVIALAGIDLIKVAGSSVCYVWKDSDIDHHRHLFDIHNPFVYRYLRRLEREETASSLRINDISVSIPSPMLQMIQVNVHILKHLLSFGIGLRQLCDAARVYATYVGQVDGTKLKQVYRKLGISRWIMVLHKLLVTYLGMPKSNLPFPLATAVSADWMMQDILTAGNFGFHDERFLTKGKNERTRKGQRLWRSFLIYFRYAPMEAICFPLVHWYSGLTK
ncbi:nucleotidyltransferase domain-containing protein [Sphingobacterium suaedae]|uniref:Nucleotidyltransferase family protein n=1 Tax=Sphingobacterium suaedae TaxID=1686402 RepID=A0ABW5KMH5_9SPHI